MKAITLCKHINKAFPDANAVTYNEWTGEEKVDKYRIWFRQEGECAPDGMPLHDYWQEWHPDGFHPDLKRLVEKHGFYLENYDAGTMMACSLDW